MKPLLYIIAESPDGPCKVGYAVNPYGRLTNLQMGNCRKLSIASTWTCNTRSIQQCERLLHHILGQHSMRGEWFKVSVAEIEKVCITQGMTKTVGGYDFTRKPTALDTRLSWLIQ